MTKNATAFQAWCLGYSGCVGGDVGSPSGPSIWVCGIEPGGVRSITAPALECAIHTEDRSRPAPGYEDWRTDVAHSFNRRIMKLLAAFHGEPVAGYRTFAQTRQPFVRGGRGFFKMNLYPVGFADTNVRRWDMGFAGVTGFARKADYLSWCDDHRLPILRRWAEASRPSLIVCLGKSYRLKFQTAFMEEEAGLAHEMLRGKQLSWGINGQGTVVAIVPFMTSASGLQSDVAIQAFGDRLREVVAAAKR